MASAPPTQIAIIGGGLCGLSLAIALKKRSVPFKIYEARASFTEIGAGINLGPNTTRTFRLIDEALGDAVHKMVTQNMPGKEEVWMTVRFGAPTARYRDAELITELHSPPTGNETAKRNDVLALLASYLDPEDAAFNKKLTALHQDGSAATLTFANGTKETVTAVVGCDGIHSAGRRLLCGDDIEAAVPQYSEVGAYRAVLPRIKVTELVGEDIAGNSTVFLGPGGYIIVYPVEGDKSVNVGFWHWKRGRWNEKEWIMPHQKVSMEEHFAPWGETAHKLMSLVPDPAFWATFCHIEQPQSFCDGRMCVIGDAAHAMPPHQGAGAGQAMEDAYVLAEVLGAIESKAATRRQIEAAFAAYETIRRPRAQKVLDTSIEAFTWWSDLHRHDLTEDELEQFRQHAQKRFLWIWNDDIVDQGKRARMEMKKLV